MKNLPAKREPSGSPEADDPPRRELSDRIRDLLKDLLHEGKELERDLEPRALPVLQRLKVELEKLIAKLQERAAQRPR